MSLKGRKKGKRPGEAKENFFCVEFHWKGKKLGIDWEKRRAGCPLKGQKPGDAQGILMGNSCCEGCPLKGKMMGLCREGKWAEKLQKLIFLKLEIMLKMDISRQTKGQNTQTKCSSKKRRLH